MTSDQAYKGSRRILWLAAGTVAAIAAYSAGWFYIAGQVEGQFAAHQARLQQQGRTLDCADAEARGYPFRVGLFCDTVGYSDPAQGLAFAAGAFRSAAQVYDPAHIIGEADGPARVAIAGIDPLSIAWTNLAASARVAEPAPERSSLHFDGLYVSFAETGAPIAAARSLEAHMRARDGAADFAATAKEATVAPEMLGGRDLPPMNGTADLTLDSGVAFLAHGARSLRGQKGELRDLSIDFGPDAGMKLDGTFAVAENGLVDADLRVTVSGPQKLAGIFAKAYPEQADQANTLAAGVTLLGGAAVPVKIRKGVLSLGFVKLPLLPPLK